MAGRDRHERVRAGWLLSHEASWHLSDRRMSNKLKSRAVKRERLEAGATEGLTHEGKLRPILERFIFRGDDPMERTARAAFVVLVLLPGLALLAGPALLAALVLYVVSTTAQLAWLHGKSAGPKWLRWARTPPRPLPWLIVALAVLVCAVFLIDLRNVVQITPWPLTIDVDWPRVGIAWLWMQVVLAPLLTAWTVRRHGWLGVKVERKVSLPKLAAPTATEGGYEDEVPLVNGAGPSTIPPLPVSDYVDEQWMDAADDEDDEIVPQLPVSDYVDEQWTDESDTTETDEDDTTETDETMAAAAAADEMDETNDAEQLAAEEYAPDWAEMERLDR